VSREFVIERVFSAPRALVWHAWTEPERLVFVVAFSGPKGGITRHPWNSDWPQQVLSTVEFAEVAGGTRVTVRSAPTEATELERRTFDEGRESMQQGWGGTFEQLGAFLHRAA
jgi:uncharacterized protein YndB with AHSA1/START domain